MFLEMYDGMSNFIADMRFITKKLTKGNFSEDELVMKVMLFNFHMGKDYESSELVRLLVLLLHDREQNYDPATLQPAAPVEVDVAVRDLRRSQIVTALDQWIASLKEFKE